MINIPLSKTIIKLDIQTNLDDPFLEQRLKLTQQLFDAISENDLSLISSLIKDGADINYNANDYHTPLILATELQKLDIVKLLVINGANIFALSNYALRTSVEKNNFEITQYLINNGADVKDCSNECLAMSVFNNNCKILKLLIDNGANYKEDNNLILKLAVANNLIDIAHYLIKECNEDINLILSLKSNEVHKDLRIWAEKYKNSQDLNFKLIDNLVGHEHKKNIKKQKI